ncbi:MAG: hypothetical protein Q9204_003734 [Flavoplaca sp. TL-2023a]
MNDAGLVKAREILLTGDTLPLSNIQGYDPGTAPIKHLFFERLLIPYLRCKLAITETIKAAIELSTELTSTLLNMIQVPNLQTAPTALQEIQLTSRCPHEWIDHLVPTSTEIFIFSAKIIFQQDQALPIVPDDTTIVLATQKADPTIVRLPVRLVGGLVQSLRVRIAVNVGIGILESKAAILEALPTFHAHATPHGVGVATSMGPPNFGKASVASGRAGRIVADVSTYQSTAAARKNNVIRTSHDRYHQTNAAGYNIKNIDQQIVTQKVRMPLASNEINRQQAQIDNARALETFLRTKYTDTKIYAWYEKSVHELYYQAYCPAQVWAKKAE